MRGKKNYMELMNQKKKKANPEKVKNLSEWFHAKRGRMSAVSRVLGCTPANVANALNMKDSYVPSHEWYLACKKAARQIESEETLL